MTIRGCKPAYMPGFGREYKHMLEVTIEKGDKVVFYLLDYKTNICVYLWLRIKTGGRIRS